MTNAISLSSGVSQQSAGTPAAGAPVAAASVASSVDSKPLTGGSSTPISPRIVVDPLAGVITQFLSATGQLESQIPSAAVVAYLRAGLTPDGLAKPTITPHSQSTTDQNQGSQSTVYA
jgi:hypothetical protein